MKSFMLAMVAATAVASSTGCCCFEKMFCCKPWGCGGCDTCGDCCGDTGCGCESGCTSCGDGYAAGGGCSSCGDGYVSGTHGAGWGGGSGCGPNGCGVGHAGCKGCGHQGIVAMPGTRNGAGMGPGGPPTAAVTYPYYINRGPRDFLAKNPPSIGP